MVVEAGALLSIGRKLREYGFAIDQAHLFFAPRLPVPAAAHPTRLPGKEDIARLEPDERIDETFLFEDYIEDALGCAVYGGEGSLLAVAGAAANSDRMWEMGVNSFAEGRGYAVSAIAALTQEILLRGKVPFTGQRSRIWPHRMSRCAQGWRLRSASRPPGGCAERPFLAP